LVRYNRVATNFFDAFEVPILIGRNFSPGDAGTDRVIINRALAQMVFGTSNPLGGRVKYVGRSREAFVDDDYLQRVPSIPTAVQLERWYEVVGVVPDFPANEPEPVGRIYHPVSFGDLYPPRIGVRLAAERLCRSWIRSVKRARPSISTCKCATSRRPKSWRRESRV